MRAAWRVLLPLGGSAASWSLAASTTSCEASDQRKDLLIVGAGKLGSLVGTAWLQAHKDADLTVTALTRTESKHEELRQLGFEPQVVSDAVLGQQQWPFVIFCAPPSGNPSYAEDVQAAARLWDGSGSFVFTSSGSVFADADGETINETSAVATTPRAAKLLAAEGSALEAGGCVVRLAGLYDLHRGPHAYWLRTGLIKRRRDGVVNLLHYEDAASLCVAVMEARRQGGVFLGSDGSASTRESIAADTLLAEKFAGREQPHFVDENNQASGQKLGKRYDNSWTRGQLQWEPRYSSFREFMVKSSGKL